MLKIADPHGDFGEAYCKAYFFAMLSLVEGRQLILCENKV